jgi:hypothetical protein
MHFNEGHVGWWCREKSLSPRKYSSNMMKILLSLMCFYEQFTSLDLPSKSSPNKKTIDGPLKRTCTNTHAHAQPTILWTTHHPFLYAHIKAGEYGCTIHFLGEYIHLWRFGMPLMRFHK